MNTFFSPNEAAYIRLQTNSS